MNINIFQKNFDKVQLKKKNQKKILFLLKI